MTEIIADITPFQSRVVIRRDCRLKEYFVSRKGAEPIVGNIYKGKVEKCNQRACRRRLWILVWGETLFFTQGDILPDKRDF